MDQKELQQITESIQLKIGTENSALIADDLGLLITKNTETHNNLVKKDAEIEKLKSDKEKLVIANGTLLQSIPMADSYNHRETTENETKESFNFRDAFDENGRFKK